MPESNSIVAFRSRRVRYIRGAKDDNNPERIPIMAVSPIPAGYHTITPYLVVKGAASALEFYQKVLGAEELADDDLERPGIATSEGIVN